MDILQTIVNILLLVAAVLLVVVVLLQDSKSSGLGSAFGSETTSLSSSRGKKASRERQLQKITVILAICVAVLAILMMLMPWFEKLAKPAAENTSGMLDVVRSIF